VRALRCLAAVCPRNGRQEETVEKCRFPLRKVEIMHDFGGNELCIVAMEKMQFTEKPAASSSTAVFLPRSGNSPREDHPFNAAAPACNAAVAKRF